MKIGVIGSGSWGCALSIAFSTISDVLIYSRNPQQVFNINNHHYNDGYMPSGVLFNSNVLATNTLLDLFGMDLLIIATPINSMRQVLNNLYAIKSNIPDVIWVCKGFEQETGLLPHQIIEDIFQKPSFKYGGLLGPSFAFDVAHEKITALVLVSKDIDFGFKLATKFNAIANFRVYVNEDVIGAEICSAVKNVIAIASGVIDGLQLGDNARAALVTRGLHEIMKLVISLHGNVNTVYGLTGLGDLMLTSNGALSRNKTVGMKLAAGKTLQNILNEISHVAEGVSTVKEVYKLSRQLKLEMPITTAVYDVLYNNCPIEHVINQLLTRESKFETYLL